MLAHACKKHIIIKTPLKIPQRMIGNGTNVSERRKKRKQKEFWQSLCLVGGETKEAGGKTGRKEGSRAGGRSRFVAVKMEDNGGKGNGWKGKKGASRGWCGV